MRNFLTSLIISLFAINAANAATLKLTRIVVFGDSLSDNGKYYKLTGRPPSPPYYQGRNSNGPVWNEHIASSLNITLDNRAVTGAQTSANHDNATYQVDTWIKESASVDRQTTIFNIWIGGNDLLQSMSIFPGAQNNSAQVITQAVETIRGLVNTLISTGAKYISVFNLPNARLLGTLAPAFNEELSKQLDQVSSSNSNVTLYRLDVPLLVETFRNAQVKENTNFNSNDTCLKYASALAWINFRGPYTICSDPDAYLLWDYIHPTAKVHCEVAKAFGSVLEIPDGGITCDGKPTFAANLTSPNPPDGSNNDKKSSATSYLDIKRDIIFTLFVMICSAFYFVL